MDIAPSIVESRIVIGDFNTMLASEDRRGGQLVTMQEVRPFLDCLKTSDLQKLKWVEDHFTWCNRQEREARIWSRIYWTLGKQYWISAFPDLFVQSLSELLSDHKFMCIKVEKGERRV